MQTEGEGGEKLGAARGKKHEGRWEKSSSRKINGCSRLEALETVTY